MLWKIDIKKKKQHKKTKNKKTFDGHISKTRTNLESALRFSEISVLFSARFTHVGTQQGAPSTLKQRLKGLKNLLCTDWHENSSKLMIAGLEFLWKKTKQKQNKTKKLAEIMELQ